MCADVNEATGQTFCLDDTRGEQRKVSAYFFYSEAHCSLRMRGEGNMTGCFTLRSVLCSSWIWDPLCNDPSDVPCLADRWSEKIGRGSGTRTGNEGTGNIYSLHSVSMLLEAFPSNLQQAAHDT